MCNPRDTGGQANTFQSDHGLVGDFWLPQCWEFMSCFGPDASEMLIIHPALCFQLHRVSSQVSLCLELAVPQPSVLVQYFLLVLQAVRVRTRWLPLGTNKAQVLAFESKLTADTFQPC